LKSHIKSVILVGRFVHHISEFARTLAISSYFISYNLPLFLINSNASLQNSFLCISFNNRPSDILHNSSHGLAVTHAVLAATANSLSLTTEAGSRVFINWNIAATSHGQLTESKDLIKSQPEANADSNAFTCGSDLNLVCC